MASVQNTGQQEAPETYRRVIHYFFSFPGRAISLNELSAGIKASKTATKIAVVRLIKEGFLKKEAVGNAWRIYANQKSPYMITKKIPYNLGLIYKYGIVARVYEKIPGARAIILFGSYRWGTDNEKSDIDIGVEVLGNQALHIEGLATFNRFGLRKNVRANLHVFSRKKIDLNLFTNIANGIVLDGLLEVHP